MMTLGDDSEQEILDFIPEFSRPWLTRFPSDGKCDLKKRLRKSTDDQNHQGAFFELFLHELFWRLRCSLEVHPNISDDKAKPDFRVRYGEECFYLEGTNVGQSDGPFTRNKNEEDVIRKLETLTSPHFDIALECEGNLEKTLRRNTVCRPFERLLDDHRPEEVRRLIDQSGLRAAPSETIDHDSWHLQGWLHPIGQQGGVSRENRQISLHHAIGKFTNAVSPLREALKEKAKKYGPLDAPLILAVNARDPFYNDEPNDLDMLFGDQQIGYMVDDSVETSQVRRKDNGLWSLDRRCEIDAVARFRGIDDFNVPYSSACLYLNPWRPDTVLPDVLLRLPHAKVCDGTLKRSDGESIVRILGIR